MNFRGFCVFFLLGLVGCLVGCADMNGLVPRESLRSAEALKSAQTFANLAPAAWPQADWWKALGDAQLAVLIDEALKENPNLAAAEARVRVASAQADLSRAALLPTLVAVAAFPGSPAGGTFPAPIAGYNSAKQINLAASYVFDFWGGNRAAWESALGQQRAAEVDAQAAKLALSSSIAQLYGELSYAFTAHDLALDERERAKRLRDLTRQRVQAGIDSLAVQHQAESTYASAQQKLAQAAQHIESVRLQLAALLGQGPDRGRSIERPQRLKLAELALPENLPANLLGRRPDIVAARWRVEAAYSEIKVTQAQFFPNINLSAVLGVMSLKTSDLLTASSRFGLLTPAISLPLFDGGNLRAQLAGRDAQYDLAVSQYNQTLIAALQEIADDLNQLRSLRTQWLAQVDARERAQQAWELANQRYRNGIGNYLEVLIFQQTLFQAEVALAELQNRRISASFLLVRALGGGFLADETPR